MRGKSGEQLNDNLFGLILGAAAIFILIILFIAMTDPFWNRGEQTAKSYWKMLNEKIEEANAGQVAEMEILPVSKQGVAIFIIYFNGDFGITINSHTFFNPGEQTDLAVCYSEKDENSKCIKLPLKIPSTLEKGEAKWWIGEGKEFTIELKENKYVFKTK